MIVISNATPLRYLIEIETVHILKFIIPTLAILERAAKKQLIDLPEAIDRLSKTRFHLKPELYEQALERDRQGKKAKGQEEQP